MNLVPKRGETLIKETDNGKSTYFNSTKASWTESEKQNRRVTAALMQFQLLQLISGTNPAEPANSCSSPNTHEAQA